MAPFRERAGWIKLHRKYLKNPIWNHDAANRVFLWFLLAAERKAGVERLGKREVAVRRGQLVTSQKEIGDATGLTRKVVRMALKFLAAERAVLLDRPRGASFTLVTVVNYAFYQGEERDEGAAVSAATRKGPNRRPKTGPGQKAVLGHMPDNGNLFDCKAMTGGRRLGGTGSEGIDGPESGPDCGPRYYKEEEGKEDKENQLPPSPPQAGGSGPDSPSSTTHVLAMWREAREEAGLAYLEDRRTLRGAKQLAEHWLTPGPVSTEQLREAMRGIVREITANPKARLFDLATLAGSLSKYLNGKKPDTAAGKRLLWCWTCSKCGGTAAAFLPATAGKPNQMPCARAAISRCDGVMIPECEGER